jgi:ABC-type multidrug transport system ATPase subunit
MGASGSGKTTLLNIIA